jgi:hypothetical protein
VPLSFFKTLVLAKLNNISSVLPSPNAVVVSPSTSPLSRSLKVLITDRHPPALSGPEQIFFSRRPIRRPGSLQSLASHYIKKNAKITNSPTLQGSKGEREVNMHPIIAITHWSHHLRESMMIMSHQIHENLHSRHFWAGVGITLLIVGTLALLFALVTGTQIEAPRLYPYGFPNKNYF